MSIRAAKPSMSISDFITSTTAESNQRGDWYSIHKTTKQYLLSLDRPCYIYGASLGGKSVLSHLKCLGISVAGFLDSMKSKWGTTLDELPVMPPATVTSDDVIVMASIYQYEIVESLRKRGIVNIVPYDDFVGDICDVDRNYVRSHIDEYSEFASALHDEQSIVMLKGLLHFSLTRTFNLFKPSPYSVYCHPDVKAEAGDVIIDGGAYIGDTAEMMFKATNNECFIHCFEPFKGSMPIGLTHTPTRYSIF